MDTEKLLVELDLLSAEIAALSDILNAEFEAIKTQDMAQLEQLQQAKEDALLQLGDGRFQNLMTALGHQPAEPDTAYILDKWQDLLDAAEASRGHLMRNQLLIQRKLIVLREALQSLYQTDIGQGVQLYNRLGKMGGDSNAR